MKNHLDHTPRRLTHDELKAAEAAFQGWEFNEAWSKAALNVYVGIRAAMIKVAQTQLMEEAHNIAAYPAAVEELRGEVLV